MGTFTVCRHTVSPGPFFTVMKSRSLRTWGIKEIGNGCWSFAIYL